MFKRKTSGEQPDPTVPLKARIGELEHERDQLLKLIGYLQNAALQMHSTIAEHAYLNQLENLPYAQVLSEMNNLRLDVLAILPRALLEGHPKAPAQFKALIGYDAENFEDPVLTAAELLGFRIHTASRLLLMLSHNSKVDTQEVRHQLKNDINVLMEHERARYKQRSLEKKHK